MCPPARQADDPYSLSSHEPLKPLFWQQEGLPAPLPAPGAALGTLGCRHLQTRRMTCWLVCNRPSAAACHHLAGHQITRPALGGVEWAGWLLSCRAESMTKLCIAHKATWVQAGHSSWEPAAGAVTCWPAATRGSPKANQASLGRCVRTRRVSGRVWQHASLTACVDHGTSAGPVLHQQRLLLACSLILLRLKLTF